MSLRYMSRAWMRAIQQLGDQGTRSAVASGPVKPVRQASENTAAAGRARRGPSGERAAAAAAAAASEDALSARRRREAEKAEIVVQLVCWGPN